MPEVSTRVPADQAKGGGGARINQVSAQVEGVGSQRQTRWSPSRKERGQGQGEETGSEKERAENRSKKDSDVQRHDRHAKGGWRSRFARSEIANWFYPGLRLNSR
jgi:hypothetical protein